MSLRHLQKLIIRAALNSEPADAQLFCEALRDCCEHGKSHRHWHGRMILNTLASRKEIPAVGSLSKAWAPIEKALKLRQIPDEKLLTFIKTLGTEHGNNRKYILISKVIFELNRFSETS